jgi:hypothetical protein
MTAVSIETTKYMLDLVERQKVRWDRGSTEQAGDYTFFCWKGNENQESETIFFLNKRIVSAVSRVEFLNDKMFLYTRNTTRLLVWYQCSECSCPNRAQNWWYEAQLLWGTRTCIWSIPEVLHENCVIFHCRSR